MITNAKNLSYDILKNADYFKQPMQLLVSRKGRQNRRTQKEDMGSIWGGILTIFSFSFLIFSGHTQFTHMMSGKYDIIKN
jgi:hypothetical protein